MDMQDAGYEFSKRFSVIRPMLDKLISDSEHVIGSYIMTICVMIGEGKTDFEIVKEMAQKGKRLDRYDREMEMMERARAR